MAKLTAQQPINHDGKDYAIGDTLTVTDKAQIAQLVDVGAAVVEGTKSRAKEAADASDAAAQAAAQADAIAKAQADTAAAAEAEAQADAAAGAEAEANAKAAQGQTGN
jgi:hypothetical protein